MYSRLQYTTDGPVAKIALNRPEVHNAFDAETISELTRAFAEVGRDPRARVVVLSGNGKNFCAGADLHWMKASAKFTKTQNERDARKMHIMLEAIYTCPKPVLAKIQGVAFGGGVGLASVVDVAVASNDAKFSLSEVRLGILPAVISPFVIRKIGVAAFRTYGLSAKRMTAEEALRIGLIQEMVSPDQLDVATERWISDFLQNAPEAMATVKSLSDRVRSMTIKAASNLTVKAIAKARAGKEGQEGMAAFFEKRKANWVS
jgi:methylglutaconyl-CoA hydratase